MITQGWSGKKDNEWKVLKPGNYPEHWTLVEVKYSEDIFTKSRVVVARLQNESHNLFRQASDNRVVNGIVTHWRNIDKTPKRNFVQSLYYNLIDIYQRMFKSVPKQGKSILNSMKFVFSFFFCVLIGLIPIVFCVEFKSFYPLGLFLISIPLALALADTFGDKDWL